MEASELKTLLLTDLVDSTGTADRIGGDAAAQLWTLHDRCARDLLVRWRGREIDKSDGFLFLFDEARQAAGYALDYHRALTGLGHTVCARVGLHVAAVEWQTNAADDVARGAKPREIGSWADKALVARVMALAPGGRTLLTARAAAALSGSGFAVVATGHWRMQGLAEPVELFELCALNAGADRPDEIERGPPVPDGAKGHAVVQRAGRWAPRREVRHTVPAERDVFVGRAAALQTLAERYRQGSRLVSILGAGGIGKTRLALRYALQWIGDHPGGVWFCDLSAALGIDGMAYAVAQGLELHLSRGEPAGQIAKAIAGRPGCLVVLDNFEQIAALAPPTLGRWLAECPEATFLVTTRSALHLPGESVFVLPSLPPDEAASLFRQRARDSGAELLGSAQEEASVEALACMLDGLPLALELAAARTRVMPPAALLSRMSERFRLLSSTGGRPPRQATLRTTLDWSWDLLTPTDRAALAQLSVFGGGFRLGDAEVVLGGPEAADPFDAIDALQSLLDHSMVRRVSAERFDLLRSVQSYAAERLGAAASVPHDGPALKALAERRHWTHFAAFDARAATAERGAALENLILACRRATAAGDHPHAVGALRNAWAVLRHTGPFQEAATLAAQVERLDGLGAAERSTVQGVLAGAFDMLGEIDAARACHDAALAAAALDGDPARRAWAMCEFGQHLYKRGDATAARRLLDDALELATRDGDAALLGSVHNALGTLESRLGRSAAAKAAYTTALAHARAIGDVRLEGGILGNLAGLAHEECADEIAQRQYEQALALTRKVNDRRWEGNTRCNLGLLLQERGLNAEAREQFETALMIARELGHPMLEGTLQCNLGILADDRGDFITACDHHTEAVGVAERVTDRRAEGQFRGYLGACLARLGRRNEAFAALDAAERCLSTVGDQASLGLLFCQRARSCLAFEERAAAGEALEAAMRLLSEAPSGELRKAVGDIARAIAAAAPD